MDEELKKWLGVENIPADYHVPFFVHEQDIGRLEVGFKRESMWKNIIIILLIFALIGTNGAWIWRESQYEDVLMIEQDVESNNDSSMIINGTGEIYRWYML